MQKASSHLEGYGCKKCAIENKKLTKDIFINKAILIHKNKYDYSEIEYKDSYSKVNIICPIHGKFEQEANSHLQGKGCPKCQYDKLSIILRKSLDVFIKEALNIHKNIYDYSQVEYINNHTKIKIICKKHGVFEQTPDKHLSGQGCPICSSSKGELLIYN